MNRSKLQEILGQYKQDFVTKQWPEERYKWEAVKHFQDHWDLDAKDFPVMLEMSLSKTGNLLTSGQYFPRRVIQEFAREEPEDVRSMFAVLFDENRDLFERVLIFRERSEKLRTENGAIKDHQDVRALSTYLWLRFPDRYYIYKWSEARKVSKALDAGYSFKKGDHETNLRDHLEMYDSICEALQADNELADLMNSQITAECYSDPELKTLTIDVGFYISRLPEESAAEDDGWWPSPEDYHPGLTVEDWEGLLREPDVFDPGSLEIMKRLKDIGGQATCQALADKYGKAKNFYNGGSSSLAERVAKRTGCRTPPDRFRAKWWPVIYTGRDATKDETGSFVYRLRAELSEALDNVDLSKVSLYAKDAQPPEAQNYWWLNANPKVFSFSSLSVGETVEWSLYNAAGNKRRTFQYFLDAKAGDLVVGYESNPVKRVVALARIASEQDGKSLKVEKVETLSSPITYEELRGYPELETLEYFASPQGSLFKLSKDEYEFILGTIREENPVLDDTAVDPYTKDDFLGEVFMTSETYDRLTGVLRNKKNIILQGAPGVGKTFAARRLAWSMMGEKDEDRVQFVQFHQNYSYEDFVMGYKPSGEGFELKNGIFYEFCQKAANYPDQDFFFLIDEINRGNLSKIFGELLMLIERDYRGTSATLAYNGLSFSVPENVHIIGMMNTADRSLAMIDYALRRRFSFFEIEPGFETEGFTNYREDLGNDNLDALIVSVQQLNLEIRRDKSLGKGFCIGHSYFCGCQSSTDATEEWLHNIVEYDILPMLAEYWFDEEDKVETWRTKLAEAIAQ